VDEQRLVRGQPEAQPRDLALRALEQPEALDVHRVVQEFDLAPRRSARQDDLLQL